MKRPYGVSAAKVKLLRVAGRAPAMNGSSDDLRSRRRPLRPNGLQALRTQRPLATGGVARHVAGTVRRVGLAQVPARKPRPEPAADGPRLRRHLLLAPLRPGDAARGDDGRARYGGAPGQGALRGDLLVLAREDAARGGDPG